MHSNRFAVAAPLPPRGILYILPSFLKISCAAAPKVAARTAAIETAHILRLFYLCCLCRCGQQSAARMDFSVYRPILQAGNFCAICIFPCPLSPARPQGRSFVKTPQISVQKCGILQDFVLYWIKNQHSRAAPGTVCQKTSTLPYRECRGEHCSPANLAQQRSFGKASHKANGHGRAMLAPTMRFFDSLCRAAPGTKGATHEKHH